ncbi:MAG: methyltransferase domain-containing protein [bacterium]|nr:methyltransferase domain-containing protein [bacterium]
MFVTENLINQKDSKFDWNEYFKRNLGNNFEGINIEERLVNARKHLAENSMKMTFILSRFMRTLLDGLDINKPNILELGAATGFMTRWLLNEYGGTATLVDNNKSSKEAYENTPNNNTNSISYVLEDVFKLNLKIKFDISCSFGLIEHFPDKNAIIQVHKKFLTENGLSIIIVPKDTPLSRTFWEVHPEQNLGYRELLTKTDLISAFENSGMKVLKCTASQGYVYDFIGAVCINNS